MKLFNMLDHTDFIISELIYFIYYPFILFESIPPIKLLKAKHVTWMHILLSHSDPLMLEAILHEFWGVY